MKKYIPPTARRVFKGQIFEVWQWKQKMYDGSTEIFEMLKRPDTAVIIATVGDKIMVQRQSQPHKKKSFISLPSGRIEKNETPLEGAKRELLEESGYVCDDWELWYTDVPYAKIDWTIYVYIARNCRKAQEPNLDAGEKIQTKFITFDEFLMLSENKNFRWTDFLSTLYRLRLYKKEGERFYKMLFKG